LPLFADLVEAVAPGSTKHIGGATSAATFSGHFEAISLGKLSLDKHLFYLNFD